MQSHKRYPIWGVFLQTSHKIVILSEAPHRFIAWYSAGRGVEGPRGSLSCQCCSELFDYPSRRTEFFLRYALDGHGYIFSCTVIIFDPQVCARSLNSGLIVPMRLSFFSRRQPLS